MEWLAALATLDFILEIIAVVSALAYVYLAAKGKSLCFAFGLISSAVYIYLAYTLSFYFDVLINGYYVIISFYGWFAWQANQSKDHLSIKRMSKKEIRNWLIIGVVTSLVLASFADRFTSASWPYLDAATTVFALIATWLVVQRKLENWLFWIGIDTLAAGMYFAKELYLTAALFLVYTVIAVFAFQNWKKQLNHV